MALTCAITVALFVAAFPSVLSHSMMSEPQSTSPRVCRLGGNPNPGTCPGPCDLTAIEGRYANFDSPDKPAARYQRGQKVRIKYQRNNHGPGGFVRHTLVPISQMMSKAAHSRNAFSYSCFGATPVVATAEERSVDRWGFSIVGNDGKTTSPGYYESTITIPPVIPDGKFVLGWVWYGGTGGETSDVPYTEEPWWKGYFSDYWSCSFVEISGGVPLEREYRPVFENDMKQFSSMGCMSANNAPGICVREPCVVEGKYQKPLPFASGAGPGMLTPEHFGGKTSDAPAGSVAPSPSPSPTPEVEDEMAMYYYEGVGGMMKLDEEEVGRSQRACMCMVRGTKCDGPSATMTGRTCRHRTEAGKQPEKCLKRCCDYCSMRFEGKLESDRAKICGENVIRGICNR